MAISLAPRGIGIGAPIWTYIGHQTRAKTHKNFIADTLSYSQKICPKSQDLNLVLPKYFQLASATDPVEGAHDASQTWNGKIHTVDAFVPSLFHNQPWLCQYKIMFVMQIWIKIPYLTINPETDTKGADLQVN